MDAFSDELLASTAQLNHGVGVDSGVDPELRFFATTAKLAHKRSQMPSSTTDPAIPAVFLLQPTALDSTATSDLTRVPFLDQCREPLAGRIWIANESLNAAFFRTHDAVDNELVELVVSLGFGTVPTVVVDPRVNGIELRYYPKGFGDLTNVLIRNLGEATADWPAVKATIDRATRLSLASPHLQVNRSSTWAKPASGWVADNAEAVIQLALRMALMFDFPVCKVEHERPLSSGRCDLSISFYNDSDGRNKNLGVIELKVLKSRNRTGAAVSEKVNLAAVHDGYVQVLNYREDDNFDWAALCCFDLRTVEADCFAAIASKAKSNKVALARWRLYRSAKELRQAAA
ncbi:hypothetical protein ACFPJ4_03570 [Lysinimonas soli]|uniref:Uncharacterized protein n=1 Tax=Lysinimonas soli TaxID=1074233 RepID=A0ABW0NQ22_9MICO